jgi:hypothetical protein
MDYYYSFELLCLAESIFCHTTMFRKGLANILATSLKLQMKIPM